MLRFGHSTLLRFATKLTAASARPSLANAPMCGRRNFASGGVDEFETAQKRLQSLSDEPDNSTKLQIYGLYKQATTGDVQGERPGVLNFVAGAKYDAWKQFAGIAQADARRQYVELVDKLSGGGGATKTQSKAGDGANDLKYGADGGPIYRIQFNRPDKFNAITVDMYDTLGRAMREADEDPNVKLTVFSGAGPYYSAGNDLTTFGRLKTPDDVREMAQRGAGILRKFVDTFISHRKPVIGLVHGPALGLTVTTLALFDVVYASDAATFQTPFTSLGYSPEGCSSVLFPKIFGHSKASEMLLFGRKISAAEALDWGLVSRVFPRASFAAETEALLQQFAQLPAESLRFNKTMIRDFDREHLHRVNAEECEKLCERWQSRDCAEAMARFMSSRK